MKKYTLTIVVLLVLAGVVGVLALVSADNFNVHYKIAVNKGWNLLHGFGAYSLVSNFISGGEISNNDIGYVYVYLPNERKYARVYPNSEVKIDDEELLNSAFWVYLKKGGRIEYDVEEEWAYANNRKMVAGWNFVGRTPDMLGLKVKDWKGNCNIERIANYRNGWEIDDTNLDGEVIAYGEDVLGAGIIVKVSNNCRLSVVDSTVNPPGLPSNENSRFCTDSDGGRDYYTFGNVRGYNEDDPNRIITAVSDFCDGDKLYEWVCKNFEEYDDESYICPNGCQNGACI